jgi:hypothetical protein
MFGADWYQPVSTNVQHQVEQSGKSIVDARATWRWAGPNTTLYHVHCAANITGQHLRQGCVSAEPVLVTTSFTTRYELQI